MQRKVKGSQVYNSLKKHYRSISSDRRIASRGELRASIEMSGRRFHVEIWQDAHNITNPNGGKYELGKRSKMPYLLGLRCDIEIRKLVSFLRNRLAYESSLDGYSMRKLAEAFGVDDHKIGVWIKRGFLKANQTGIVVGRNEKAFIRVEDVRRFMLHHPEEFDHTKVDKYWLLGILCPKDLCAAYRSEVA